MSRYILALPGSERLIVDVDTEPEPQIHPDAGRSYVGRIKIGLAHLQVKDGVRAQVAVSVLEAEHAYQESHYRTTTGFPLEKFIEYEISEDAARVYHGMRNNETGEDEEDDEDADFLTAEAPEEDLEENYRQGFEGHRGP